MTLKFSEWGMLTDVKDRSGSCDVQASPVSAHRHDWKYLRVCRVFVFCRRETADGPSDTALEDPTRTSTTVRRATQVTNQLVCELSGLGMTRTNKHEAA